MGSNHVLKRDLRFIYLFIFINIVYQQGGGKYIPETHHCVNRCCQDSPCFNGGVCEEICDPLGIRFNCTCPDIYTGQRCEKLKPLARSCKDIAKNGSSDMHVIFDSSDEPFSVFCDADSEPGFVWALVQSFSLTNKDLFAVGSVFGTDFPVNNSHNDVDWNAYRLSLLQMQSIANHSTHLRATCNYLTDGLLYTDYARAKLEGHDIFGTWENYKCQLYEYVNIRGNECSNCTALTKQPAGRTWYMNSHQKKECEFDGTPGAVNAENNFGRYVFINDEHRCSSSLASTTQHWFGVKHDL